MHHFLLSFFSLILSNCLPLNPSHVHSPLSSGESWNEDEGDQLCASCLWMWLSVSSTCDHDFLSMLWVKIPTLSLLLRYFITGMGKVTNKNMVPLWRQSENRSRYFQRHQSKTNQYLSQSIALPLILTKLTFSLHTLLCPNYQCTLIISCTHLPMTNLSHTISSDFLASHP